MKHFFIINPAAGKKGSTDEIVNHIQSTCKPRGLDYEISFTQRQGDAEALSRAAAQTGDQVRVYACGGDGTLNEVVNGTAGFPNAAITNVPKGTGNDFLRIFGANYRSRFSDLDALVDGPQAQIDLMDCNGKLGIGVICAGVDARIAADVHKYKGLPLVTGMGAYILSLVENVLFKGIARPVSVAVEGKQLEGMASIICVLNGRFYGGGFMPMGEAEPDDGILDMLIVPQVTRRTFFRLVGKYAKGKYRECPDLIRVYHGSGLSFTAKDGCGVVVVDGEVMRGKTFHICLSEQKANFFYPADLDFHTKAGQR